MKSSVHARAKTARKRKRAPVTFLMLNPNPIIEADFEGKIYFQNPSTETIFPDLKTKGLRHPVFSGWKQIVTYFKDKKEASLRREIQIGENWFIQQIFRVPNTNRIRIYFTSINDLKKAQQELEKERNLLQTVMNGSKNFQLVYLDTKFNFVHVNEAYAKSCGYTPKEIVGKNLFSIYPNYEEIKAIFRNVCKTGNAVEFTDSPFTFPNQPQRGVTYWDWTLKPVKGKSGKVAGLVLSMIETTDRRKGQEKLREYATQMEHLAEERAKELTRAERMAAIGQTAGMVGHDIRNPLQAMAGELYLAKEELELLPDSEAKRNLQDSLSSIERNLFYIDKIVADLQDYTKPLKPNKDKVNAEKAIEEALLIVNIPSNLQVSINVENGFPNLTADMFMLKRVLINLIQNAVQAMPNGGALKIYARTQNSNALISVEDSGEGIPEEAKDKLFTPLFTTKSKGQGFGLAVVKRLVEAQDGKISFESQKGKGTTFTIQLPVHPETKQE